MRELPNIPLAEIEGYAHAIARGWDTVKETFDLHVSDALIEQLENCKRHARADHGGGLEIQFGGETLKLSEYGTRSALFVLGNDDFTIFIRSPRMPWCVSVEYRSAGLWEYGFEALRERALKCILKECPPKCGENHRGNPANWQRVSIAHFAFDFYSPEFSKDMTGAIFDRVICPSAVKKRENFECWGRGNKLETITIGKKDTLQVQIYDKGKEITNISGKEWMFKIWERAGYYPPDDKKAKDVWRIELRFGADFLRNRGILTIFDLYDVLPAILTEGLFTRRLTVESVTDKNRWRWPLHPLYVAAYRQVGENVTEMIPMGRVLTQSDQARIHNAKQAIAGYLRSLTVLSIGDMDEGTAKNLIEDIYALMLADPDGEAKAEKARLRYLYVKEAT